MKKHIMFFFHVWKAIDHTIILALIYFPYFFWCLLMNIFLTQFWTEKLLIHKPQPRHTLLNFLKLTTPPQEDTMCAFLYR